MENEEIFKFLKDKSMTLSIRLKISEIEKLLEGEELVVNIRGVKFNLKKAG